MKVSEEPGPNRSQLIRTLNDRCRQHFLGCTVMMIPSVQALSNKQSAQLFRAVRDFDQFDAGNDPHHEHDFGAIDLFGQNWFFKFDYYNESLIFGSDDPSNVEKTRRTLTIMRADEY